MLKMQSRLQPRKRILPQFLAIVGGSGAGKTWLAKHLQQAFGKEAAILSLDNFYRDRSHLTAAQRGHLNFDHPKAIDWAALKNVLETCAVGKKVSLPNYDFATHTVKAKRTVLTPKRLVFLEGMWLLRPGWLRKLFSLRIYIDCPKTMRRERRLQRDQSQRGRTVNSICEQFDSCVAPMHQKFVEPQKSRADIVLNSPVGKSEVQCLVRRIQAQLQHAL
jgi:uridine kinase